MADAWDMADEAPKNAPINKGVDDRVYAVVREAGYIGRADFKDAAHSIELAFEDMTIPFFESYSVDQRAFTLASAMAEATGRPNVLYVDDRFGASTTSTIGPGDKLRMGSPVLGAEAVDHVAGDQSAFVSGDPGAAVTAGWEDLKSSAKEAAQKIPEIGLDITIVVAIAVGALILWKVR